MRILITIFFALAHFLIHAQKPVIDSTNYKSFDIGINGYRLSSNNISENGKFFHFTYKDSLGQECFVVRETGGNWERKLKNISTAQFYKQWLLLKKNPDSLFLIQLGSTTISCFNLKIRPGFFYLMLEKQKLQFFVLKTMKMYQFPIAHVRLSLQADLE